MNGKGLVMIEIDIAESAVDRMYLGETVKYTHPEQGKFEKVLLAKEAYYITVQGDTNKLAIPIQWTDYYQEDLEKMRMPANSLGAAPSPKPRGRPPRKTGNAAPADVQTNMGQQPMPPGQQYDNSFGSFPSPQAALQAAGVIPATPTPAQPPVNPAAALVAAMQPAALRPPGVHNEPVPDPKTEMRIEQAEDDPDWFRNSLEDAFNTFKEHIIDAAENAINEAYADGGQEAVDETLKVGAAQPYNPTPVPLVQKIATCANCIYVGVDPANGEKTFCSKFNIIPPIFVAIAPEGKCMEFIDSDDDIPF